MNGFRRGEAEGRAQGMAQGMAQGLAEGKKKKQLEIAKKMKNKKMPLETIIDLTDLSKEEIVISFFVYLTICFLCVFISFFFF